MKQIVVIGGSNIDILAKSEKEMIQKDSNIGFVSFSSGGVGRNIVENLARLGCNVTFISAIGNDAFGNQIKNELIDLNVNVITPNTHFNTSSYIAIHDNSGDMVAAINDMKIVDTITIDYLKDNSLVIENSDFIILETNLSKEVIDYITTTYSSKKISADAISTKKALKLKDCLSKLYLLKVNNMEYEALKDSLNNAYPEYLLITNGSENVIVIHKSETTIYPVKKQEKIVNATGAGDSLLSGTVASLYYDFSLKKSIENGIKIASITLQDESSVSKQLSKKVLDEE